VGGDLVSVFGAVLNGSITNLFNGVFQVLSSPAPTSTTFYYQMTSDPKADPFPTTASCAKATACPLVSSGTTATFTTSLRHTLEAGQGIIVSDLGTPYDGGFTIASVPTPETLTYEMASAPSGNADPSAQISSVWQVGRIVAERNIIALVLNFLLHDTTSPVGISVSDSNRVKPFTFRQVVIRGNIIRTVDNAVGASTTPVAIALDSCENALIQRNIVNVNNSTPVYHLNTCGAVKYFNNQTPTGLLVQGHLNPFAPVVPQYLNELGTDVDLAGSLST